MLSVSIQYSLGSVGFIYTVIFQLFIGEKMPSSLVSISPLCSTSMRYSFLPLIITPLA